MTAEAQLELAQPEIVVGDQETYCVPCKRQFKSKFGLTMHRVTFHEKRGAGALAKRKKGTIKLTKKKRGRPLGSKTQKVNYCESCKKSFKGAHGLAIHNSQVHILGVANRHKNTNLVDGGKVRASIQSQSHASEEINLAFLAGALCERLLLSPGHELLAELVTGRLSAAARVENPQVR
jgi:hypothetical protein